MNEISFPVNSNFILIDHGWNVTNSKLITSLLDWIVWDFITVLNDDEFTKIKPVYIYNESLKENPDGYPEYQKSLSHNKIYLATNDMYWCQYSYQFIHELLHHTIYPEGTKHLFVSQFGWLEESLCELTSITFMDRMVDRWITNTPEGHFRGYARSIAKYVEAHLAKIEIPEESFGTWLTSNIDDLYKDRYDRPKNKIVAYQLYPIFKNDPDLWRSVLYLKEIEVPNVPSEMDLNAFLIEWQNCLPSDLKDKFEVIKNTLFIS